MPNVRRRAPLLAVLTVAVLASACSAAASPSTPQATPAGSGSPSPSPSQQPSGDTGGLLDHATGATDVLLRLEEGGGLMMMEWSATQVPIFTLYGDGTVIFRDPAAQPMADPNGLLKFTPFKMARLGEERIQELLAFAINDSGLGTAKERYDNPLSTDAATSTFTVSAGGRTKKVEVYDLATTEGMPDRMVRAQFLALADRLKTFDDEESITTEEYTPQAWRAVLIESPGIPQAVRPWAWPAAAPKDFVVADPNVSSFAARTLTSADIAALEMGELKGGLLGLYAKGPDGKTYSIPIRPLLPDEES